MRRREEVASTGCVYIGVQARRLSPVSLVCVARSAFFCGAPPYIPFLAGRCGVVAAVSIR